MFLILVEEKNRMKIFYIVAGVGENIEEQMTSGYFIGNEKGPEVLNKIQTNIKEFFNLSTDFRKKSDSERDYLDPKNNIIFVNGQDIDGKNDTKYGVPEVLELNDEIKDRQKIIIFDNSSIKFLPKIENMFIIKGALSLQYL